MKATHSIRALMVIGAVFLVTAKARSQQSYSLTGAKTPKHYFNTIIVVDAYRKPQQDLKDTSDLISKKLKTYAIKQLDISFCTPLLTTDDPGDTMSVKNEHLLLTGNYTSLQPVFNGIDQHRLVKFGIGLRYIYNTGKKGVWFVDAAPFITRDATFASKATLRLASTLIYSYNVNDHFNWRLGVTKSFLWGNRFYWPFIGLRVGRLDKINLSIQFPRCINLNIPISSNFIVSLYTKPQGGVYNFSNRDSLYYRKQDGTFNFTRYEINSGLRVDVRLGKNFNFYLASGISSRNSITFYSESANSRRPRLPYRTYFYTEKMQPTLFFNAGIVLKFGKTRSYFNNRNMYDAINMGNVMQDNGNAQIPLPPKKKRSDANLESIRDLIDYNDF